ncbi:type VI secretion system protein TssA [Tropicimonas sp.]|uniref:type VI secretion system protein TssA n=1 Tax=Tropicimonas sp. TaxID=2067044 RepID=UPI003A8A8CD8
MTIEVPSFGADAPSGVNLEYEPVFTALEIAAQPGEERQRGNEIVAAEEPDYKEIIARAHEVLSQSHDLRAAVHLAHAELRRNGIAGLAGATGYIRACLSDYWDTCHPQLDADDDNDPTMRVNAIRDLAGPGTVLPALRLAPLTASRTFGRISLRDLMLQEGEVAPRAGESLPDAASIAAAFRDTEPQTLVEMRDAARRALDDVNEVDRIFGERTPGRGPDLGELQKLLGRIVARLVQEAPQDIAAPAPAEADDWGTVPVAPAVPAPATGGAPGGITSPRDVIAALDRIVDYYASAEPSSPVPIFLRRARRLVGADFMTIMNDMAPAGVSNVKVIGGLDESAGAARDSAAPAPKKDESSDGW